MACGLSLGEDAQDVDIEVLFGNNSLISHLLGFGEHANTLGTIQPSVVNLDLEGHGFEPTHQLTLLHLVRERYRGGLLCRETIIASAIMHRHIAHVANSNPIDDILLVTKL